MHISISKKREGFLDWSRGVTILLMITTHIIGIVYNGQNSVVSLIGQFGGITSFTSFLLISGISSYISFIKIERVNKEEIKIKRGKIINKVVVLIFLFYILSILGAQVLHLLDNNDTFSIKLSVLVVNILSFSLLVPFTEFLPTLAIFSLSTITLKRFYKFISDKLLLILFFGLILFLIGTCFIKTSLGDSRLDIFKSLFVGHIDPINRIHSFPLFQYFIIFILGIFIGNFITNFSELKSRVKFLFKGVFLASLVTLLSQLLLLVLKLDVFYPLPNEGRFPPSVGFLSISLGISLLIIILCLVLEEVVRFRLIKLLFEYIGRNAISIYLFHLVTLFLIKVIIDNGNSRIQLYNLIGVLAYFIIVTIISLTASYVVKILIQETRRLNQIVIFLGEVLFLVILAIFILGEITFNNYLIVKQPEIRLENLQKNFNYRDNSTDWWNNIYSYRKELIIKNDSPIDLNVGTWMGLVFNHEQLLKDNKSLLQNGGDLRIIYVDNNKNKISLPLVINQPGTSNTELDFQLPINLIAKESTTSYYLYYGDVSSNLEAKPNTQPTKVVEGKISLLSEEGFPLTLSSNGLWYLKSSNGNMMKNPNIKVKINNLISEENKIYNYNILNTNITGILKKYDSSTYIADLDLSTLTPGVYTLQARIIDLADSLKIYQSNYVLLKVSYPLYVAWTYDWEGWDVPNYELNAINSVANSNNIPLTDLFNPRIYLDPKNQNPISKYVYNNGLISTDRAVYLTNWIKNRAATYGDEIGFHMHMYNDMVKAAGVTTRSGPIISGAGYGDVQTSAYNQNDLEKIFNWGLNEFQLNGLPKPITYRAGGWFGSVNVLNAASNVGFLIDSSGRTGGHINPNQSYSSLLPWSLTDTTHPYKPSVDNINTWSGTRMNIFEFPNNGADSYWFTKDQLLQRFNDNINTPNGIISQPQVLTYLTHPHWFTSIDQPKVKPLFSYINNFLFNSDKGPVIYTTLSKVYNSWDRVKDINGN